jgi:hypothetical protein
MILRKNFPRIPGLMNYTLIFLNALECIIKFRYKCESKEKKLLHMIPQMN